jgi:hypothetical protein
MTPGDSCTRPQRKQARNVQTPSISTTTEPLQRLQLSDRVSVSILVFFISLFLLNKKDLTIL